MKTRNKRGESS